MRQIIGTREKLKIIESKATDIHIGFRPSEKDIFFLLERCPDLKSVQLPKVHMRTMSDTAKKICTLRNVELIEGTGIGAEKYIN